MAKNAAQHLPTPLVTSTKLQNLINNLYKGTTNPTKIGNGTTADALRYELTTGQQVGGKFHGPKAEESLRGLENWLRGNPNASYGDRVVAESLAMELRSVISGGP